MILKISIAEPRMSGRDGQLSVDYDTADGKLCLALYDNGETTHLALDEVNIRALRDYLRLILEGVRPR